MELEKQLLCKLTAISLTLWCCNGRTVGTQGRLTLSTETQEDIKVNIKIYSI